MSSLSLVFDLHQEDCHDSVSFQIISKEFSGQIDLSHTVEGGDNFTRHRQLRIVNIRRQQGGLYTCQVGDISIKFVLIFTPVKYLL